MKKTIFSNAGLMGILAGLGLLYLGLQWFGRQGRSASLDEAVASVDTANVQQLIFTQGSQKAVLQRINGRWQVQLADGRLVLADSSRVQSVLLGLTDMRPSRLLAKKPTQWAEYQTDTAGTRLQVMAGTETLADLVFGKFGMKGGTQGGYPSGYYTAVRRYDDEPVYAVDDLLKAHFVANPQEYRINKLIALSPVSITAITVDGMADGSFALRKEASQWLINGQKADSVAVENYLYTFQNVFHTRFVDDIQDPGTPSGTLTIETGASRTVLRFWTHPTHQWLWQSPENPEALFADPEGLLATRFFKAPASLKAPANKS